MEFTRSGSVAARFEYLSEAGSTNDELVRRACGADASSWPDLSVIVTENQTGGRGRLGRTWVAPAGRSLAVSVLLRPTDPLPIESLAWIPLMAGVAMSRAVASVVPDAALKWPNDVLIRRRKVCGILSELLPGMDGVVVGSGLNTALTAAELPTETSTSLVIELAELAGRDVAVPAPSVDADAVLADYLRELAALYRAFTAAGGDAAACGLRADVVAACESIGRPVRVELPSGRPLTGEAVDIDGEGRLVVRSNTALTAVAAGDVTHLRY